jgi:radical SAM/Cys-rich protein
MEARSQLLALRSVEGVPPFEGRVNALGGTPLAAHGIEVLQINVGKRCNLRCRHCHVEAGPERGEAMPLSVMRRCVDAARLPSVSTVDITGGAPEMNENLEWLIRESRGLGKRVIVRSNLAILAEEEHRRFLDIYAGCGVEIACSLPDCSQSRTDRQRGDGTFQKVIAAMRSLNARGYGVEGTGLVLDIVHNPIGAYLPASQEAMEREYRRRLCDEHGVSFNALFCLTNLPVGHFLEYLIQSGNLEDYLRTLAGAFNPAAARRAMCTNTLSVGWDGALFDCDFNQVLELPVDHGAPTNIRDFDPARLNGRGIVVGNHCYGCAAGAGSSCQGTTA